MKNILLYEDFFNIEVNNYIILERMIMCQFDWDALNSFERMKIVINNSNVNHVIQKSNNSQKMYANGEI